MSIDNIAGDVRVNGRPVSAAMNNRPVSSSDLIETGFNGRVTVKSDTQTAAVVSGPGSAVTTYTPPTRSLIPYYYNYSYRYQLRTPGGEVGIRG